MRIDYVEGDVVVALDDGTGDLPCSIVPLVPLGLYTVSKIAEADESPYTVCGVCESSLAVDLAEYPDQEWSYCVCSFRKAYTPSIDVQTERQQPIPSKKVDA